MNEKREVEKRDLLNDVKVHWKPHKEMEIEFLS